MQISAVATASRSNSLPMDKSTCKSPSDDVTDSDPFHNSSCTPGSTKPTLHFSSGGGTRANDLGYLEPIQNEPDPVCEDVQGTSSNDEQTDTDESGVSLSYDAPVAQRGRLFAKCQRSMRLIKKNGHSNVTMTKVQKKNRRYIRDMFTTLMDLKLRYHILLFISCFTVSWLIFAIIWFALAKFHGDIERDSDDNAKDICLNHVYDFSTALLYSLETQTTIGYGYRVIGPECPLGTSLLMAQSCIGIFIQCFITGIVFAKIAKSKRRAKTIVFSYHAVICMRDGVYNLVFRVGDLRRTHIIGTSIRAFLVKSRLTNEGELLPLCQHPLDLVTESSITDSFVSFFWPVTIAHRITESSPLWNLSAETILSQQFELVVVLEGSVQTSGSLIQSRTSYTPNEIKWGERFTPLETHPRDDDCEIDYSNFHGTTPVYMPDYSAEEYAHRKVTNRLYPVKANYAASLKSSPILSHSNRKTTKKHRLQKLCQRKRLGIRLNKSSSGKNSVKDESLRRDDTEEMSGLSSSEAAILASLPPPPTYASVAKQRAIKGHLKELELVYVDVRTTEC